MVGGATAEGRVASAAASEGRGELLSAAEAEGHAKAPNEEGVTHGESGNIALRDVSEEREPQSLRQQHLNVSGELAALRTVAENAKMQETTNVMAVREEESRVPPQVPEEGTAVAEEVAVADASIWTNDTAMLSRERPLVGEKIAFEEEEVEFGAQVRACGD